MRQYLIAVYNISTFKDKKDSTGNGFCISVQLVMGTILHLLQNMENSFI